jgi:hypothetical protein
VLAVPAMAAEAAPYPTDEAVRNGMIGIRDLVRLNHSLITHRRMPPDHAARFARQVKAEADKIAATSRITDEARKRLQSLLDEIVAGTTAVAARQAGVDPMDGLVRADEALARYPKEFDHPGWGAAAVARLAAEAVGTPQEHCVYAIVGIAQSIQNGGACHCL